MKTWDERDEARAAKMRSAKAAVKRAARLKVWKREGVRILSSYLSLRWSRYRITHGRAGMFGWVALGAEATDTWDAVVIVHEMTHIALYRMRHPQRRGHGQAFRGLYLAAACEFFGISEAEVLKEWPKHKGSRRLLAYDLDLAVASVASRKERS